MKIEKGQYIKILFRNASAAEGIVESWENDDYVLKSLDGKSFLIVQSPKDDIMAIKVMTMPQPEEEKSSPNLAQTCGHVATVKDMDALRIRQQEQLAEFAKAIKSVPQVEESLSEQELKVRKLADLRIAQAEAERKIIAEKLKDHHISETRKVEYGLPGFLKKPSTK